MADYGKLCTSSVEWNDRELLLRLFQRRVLQGFGEKPPPWDAVWRAVSVQSIDGTYTLDFLLDASLMRPRYLIRVFEMARRRAVTLGRDQIEEPDYKAGLSELGWQVLEDFDRELTDVVPDAQSLLFDISKLGERTSLTKLKGVIARKVGKPDVAETVIDVLIWTGCVGVLTGNGPVYISDCGFKRQFMRSLMDNENDRYVIFHPTLASIFGAPGGPQAKASVRRGPHKGCAAV